MWGEKLIVAIPTMYLSHLEPIFDNYKAIDLTHVEKIIVFNNSEKVYRSPFEKIFIVNLGQNIGVNPAWNHALLIAKAGKKDLMLLNDDVMFNSDFFTKTHEALEDNRQFAVVCPETSKTRGDFYGGPSQYISRRYTSMRRRVGWAFTINRDFVKNIPLMPESMTIFFGDDWIWHFTDQKWVKDNSNLIFHSIGKTTRKHKDLRARYRSDKQIFTFMLEKIKNENTG